MPCEQYLLLVTFWTKMIFSILFIFYILSPSVLALEPNESSLRPEVYGNDDISETNIPFGDTVDGLFFIVNGCPAVPGQFPWQVYLQLWVIPNSVYRYCGGSLISPTWILTAAHCFENITATTAYLGITSLNDKPRATVDATRIIIHDDYNKSTLHNDIALVELSSPVDTSFYVASIPLASTTLEPGHLVTVSGWGQTSDNSTAMSITLNYANLTTIDNDVCSHTYRNITSGIGCAKGLDKQSTCHGDSGGAVTTGSRSDAVHVGIISFTNKQKGCDRGYPIGFTRTAAYRGWIHSYAGV